MCSTTVRWPAFWKSTLRTRCLLNMYVAIGLVRTGEASFTDFWTGVPQIGKLRDLIPGNGFVWRDVRVANQKRNMLFFFCILLSVDCTESGKAVLIACYRFEKGGPSTDTISVIIGSVLGLNFLPGASEHPLFD